MFNMDAQVYLLELVLTFLKLKSTVEALYCEHPRTTWSVLIKKVSLFQRLFSTLLYVAGTTGSVLIREVSLIQR